MPTSRPAVVRMPISGLVKDFGLYPRHRENTANRTNLRRALDAGEALPPIVACADSRRIVDGFHRASVYQAIDANLEVDVELIHYPDEAARLLDAIRRNATHGDRLGRFDQARCVLLADELHIDAGQLAAALALTSSALGELRTTKTATDSEGHPVPIKATARHLAGTKLNERRAAAATRTGGMSVRFYVNQVRNALDGDLVDWDDRTIIDALTELRDAIDVALATAPAAV